MKYQVGDLLKYNDGVEYFTCVVVEMKRGVVIIHWLDNDHYSTELYVSYVAPHYGWSKLS